MNIVMKWKRVLRGSVFALLGIAGIFLVIQLVYPPNSTVPLATVDGLNIGAASVDDASASLTVFYQEAQAPVKQAATGANVGSLSVNDAGIHLANPTEQAESQLYPWPLRFIPTSILWAHFVLPSPVAMFNRDVNAATSVVDANFSNWCDIAPVNAHITVSGADLLVEDSATGINCDRDDLAEAFARFSPTANSLTFTIPSAVAQPKLTTSAARDVREDILSIFTDKGLVISSDQGDVELSKETVLSWFSFPASFDTVPFAVSPQSISAYFDDLAAHETGDRKKTFAQVDEQDLADQLTAYVLADKADRQTLSISELKVAQAIDAFMATHDGTFNAVSYTHSPSPRDCS